MASQNIGTFYGFANGNSYGRYSCVLYWDNVTRNGKKVTIHNPRVEMTNTDPGKYTVNRIAGYAAIGDKVPKANYTLNSYQTQSPNAITFSIGTTEVETTGTSVGIYIAIASTGGSSNWENFQSTPLEWWGSISCPPANPTYTTKPSISNIQETSLIINRGSTDIASKFYYKQGSSGSWIELTAAKTTLSNLQPDTDYEFYFKSANAELPDLETTITKPIAATTYSYPYITNVAIKPIDIGSTQTVTIHNPLAREVSVFMTHETQNGAVIYEGTTNTQISYAFVVPIDAACSALGSTNTVANAQYFCKYNNVIVSSLDGQYKTTEATFKPFWDDSQLSEMFKYKDGNAGFVDEITKDDQMLVQEFSQLFYGVNYSKYPATTKYGSAIQKYQISINHQDFIDIPNSSATASIDAGLIIPAEAKNITIQLRAIDSRGYISNTITKILRVETYSAPYGSIEVEREGGYGETISLTIRPIWGVNENNIGTAVYRYGKNNNQVGENITTSTFNTPILLAGFDNESSFKFEVVLTDKLGRSSKVLTGAVGIGEPILFIDVGETPGVGVNCFPETKGLYVKGDAVFKNQAIAQQNLTVQKNTTIHGHLDIGAHRRQTLERDGKQRTGWFYIGGSN